MNESKRRELDDEFHLLIDAMNNGEEFDKEYLEYLFDVLGYDVKDYIPNYEDIEEINDEDIDLDDDIHINYGRLSVTSMSPNAIRDRRLSKVTFDEDMNDVVEHREWKVSVEDDPPDEEQDLRELELEIELLESRINDDDSLDDLKKDLQELYYIRANNPKYIEKLEKEMTSWRISIQEYCSECLKITRSFIPVSIASESVESLMDQFGYNKVLAKRLTQKQCLWLVRMSTVEIERLHEKDLMTRYSVTGQLLDIIELSAIYGSIASATFSNDQEKKKSSWKDSVEATLRNMMHDRDLGSLPVGKLRAVAYGDAKLGPIGDFETVRGYEIMFSKDLDQVKPRRSFQEVCGKYSIIRRRSMTTAPDANSIPTLLNT